MLRAGRNGETQFIRSFGHYWQIGDINIKRHLHTKPPPVPSPFPASRSSSPSPRFTFHSDQRPLWRTWRNSDETLGALLTNHS